ncbi:MAG TPA: PSD1 and planctomycete cytochrome C domain-containing protein [Planctomycetota bacterium]|nr:PSD1 and planctomycete cytochrome C domain-containing protein [Planctomycetota bacterium]
MRPFRVALILAILPAGTLPAQEAAPADAPEHFEKKIRPLLHQHCLKCHGPEKPKGGLRIDSRTALLQGGDSGPAVVPGDPDKSLLLKALKQTDPDLIMPPRKSGPKLPDAALRDVETWIRNGAPYPGAAEPPSLKHWAFQPLRNPAVPDGAANPIDAFLKLDPAAAVPADKRTLIRRITYDLTGLPPTPEEVDAFVHDPARDASAKLVERLLASPAYGEKWGRKWLDVVRYADTAGENSDYPVPNAWRYRNYVIEAFNRDLPYDRFLREQIAGDLLAEGAPPERYAELVTATGYLAIARRFGHDIDRDMHLTYEDVIDTMGKSLLGLTLGCARCHNHKYDPVTTRDYYALYGILASSRFSFPGCEAKQAPRDMVPMRPPMLRDWADEHSEFEDLTLPKRTIDVAYGVVDGKAADTRLQNRGEPDQLGDPVPRRNLELLGGQPLSDVRKSGRLDLAAWISDPKNPLTARVMVNRIWQGHFGKGIVATPNDFGTRGAAPSHPELLDYLAGRFIASGWSVKAVQRLILSSAAYQAARFPRRRLDAEEIRDSLLAASLELDRSPGEGHPFPPESQWKFTQHNPFKAVYDSKRRSVYLMTQRIQRHPFLALFDGPDTNASTARRDTSTVPTQALYFLNDPFFHARSQALAKRLLALPADERVAAAHRICFQRAPLAAELRHAAAFLEACRAELGAGAELAGWSAYARTLLGSNEFLYLD